MKQFMIDMMNAMMPYMKFPLWAGVALAALGIIFLVLQLAQGKGNWLKLIGWFLISIGIFYLACHAMGLYLGMTPKINFGDATKFEFNLVPFWQLGAGALITGAIFRILHKKPSDIM